MSSMKTHMRDGFFVVASNLLEKGVFFLLFLLIARNYSVEQYGLLVSAFAIGNIAGAFFDFGFVFAFQRESAAQGDEFLKRLPAGIIFRFLCWVPYLLVVSATGTGGASNLHVLILLASAVYIYSINNDLNAVLNGQKSYKSVFRLLLIARSVLLVISAVLIYMGFALHPVLYMFLLSGVVHFILLAGKLGLFRKSNEYFSITNVKGLVLLGAPFSISYILNWVYDKVDVLLIERFLNLHAVAMYATAYSIYKLPQSFANGLITPLYTDFSNEYAENGYLQLQRNKSRILWVFLLSLFSGLVFYLFASEIILLMYGDKFKEADVLLTYLAIGLPFLLMNNVTGVMLNAIRREKAATFSVFAAGLLNISVNVMLLPVIGVAAAVFATIAAEAVILILQIIFLFARRENLR